MIKPVRTGIALLIAALVCLLTGCSSTEQEDMLRFGIMPDLNCIPFVVAQQQGFFGSNIELELYKSAMDRDSALMSGNMDGVSSDILAVLLAREGEFPVYITSRTNGSYGLLVSEESNVISAVDLEEREIGLSVNTVIEYVTDCILQESGADLSRVKKIAIPQIPSRLELLEAGRIDAITVPEPYVTAADRSGAVLISTSADVGLEPGIVLFTEAALQKKPELLTEFYKSYNQAVKYINETPVEEFMPAVIELLGLPQTTLDVALPHYQEWSLPEEDEVVRAMEWLTERELLAVPCEYEELVWIIQ